MSRAGLYLDNVYFDTFIRILGQTHFHTYSWTNTLSAPYNTLYHLHISQLGCQDSQCVSLGLAPPAGHDRGHERSEGRGEQPRCPVTPRPCERLTPCCPKAFQALFQEHGPEICAKIMQYHKTNGGLGRAKKIKYGPWPGSSFTNRTRTASLRRWFENTTQVRGVDVDATFQMGCCDVIILLES